MATLGLFFLLSFQSDRNNDARQKPKLQHVTECNEKCRWNNLEIDAQGRGRRYIEKEERGARFDQVQGLLGIHVDMVGRSHDVSPSPASLCNTITSLEGSRFPQKHREFLDFATQIASLECFSFPQEHREFLDLHRKSPRWRASVRTKTDRDFRV